MPVLQRRTFTMRSAPQALDRAPLLRCAAQRGKTPIVVGGTGFYLRWFILGKPATPGATPASEAAARERLDQVCVSVSVDVCVYACACVSSKGGGRGGWGCDARTAGHERLEQVGGPAG